MRFVDSFAVFIWKRCLNNKGLKDPGDYIEINPPPGPPRPQIRICPRIFYRKAFHIATAFRISTVFQIATAFWKDCRCQLDFQNIRWALRKAMAVREHSAPLQQQEDNGKLIKASIFMFGLFLGRYVGTAFPKWRSHCSASWGTGQIQI